MCCVPAILLKIYETLALHEYSAFIEILRRHNGAISIFSAFNLPLFQFQFEFVNQHFYTTCV